MMTLAVEIIGIITMFTLIFCGIWGFIILNLIIGQMRYKNYLLEKLVHYAQTLTKNGEVDLDKLKISTVKEDKCE